MGAVFTSLELVEVSVSAIYLAFHRAGGVGRSASLSVICLCVFFTVRFVFRVVQQYRVAAVLLVLVFEMYFT